MTGRKEVGLRDARAVIGDLVRDAQYGITTVITRNGKPVAMVVPHKPEDREWSKTEFMETLAAEIADLDPRLDWDMDTGYFVVVPVGAGKWARVDMDPYGSVSSSVATDERGSMVAEGLSHGIREPREMARFIRALVWAAKA